MTGEYLVKFKILKDIPICVCQNGFYTIKHIVQKCEEFENTRAFLEQDTHEINPHININETCTCLEIRLPIFIKICKFVK